MESSPFLNLSLSLVLLLSAAALVSPARSGDAEALLSLKSSVDPLNLLPWPQGRDACKWRGIKECINKRVSKLVVEDFNLTGTLDGGSLNQLDQLRVLSFEGNSISGPIPDLSGMSSLKSLFLNHNNFSGGFPESITGLHRLKVVALANNRMSGPVPATLLRLTRLRVLHLQDNAFTGKIPPLNQKSLRFFNVSNNKLSGQIPPTSALLRFDASSFSGNVGLCGEQVQSPCTRAGPEPSPGPYSSKHSGWIKIVFPSIVVFLLILCCLLVWALVCKKRGWKKYTWKMEVKEKAVAAESGMVGNNGGKQGGFHWGGEGLGTLVFLGAGDQKMRYSLDDLLRASAEALGRGTMGSTYKAWMESGFIVTVKRLKDAIYPSVEEFRRHMDVLGMLRHPCLVPLRAYFQAKEERLIVYDYFPNGSLFSLLHGSRTSGGTGKPLHWTSCLKIAEDLARGLLYIHQNPCLTHGNLKSSNVLMSPEFESCLTDYGLNMFRDPDSLEEPGAASLFYRAPESRGLRKPPTQQADVYSFGVLLLEILTGKTPSQDFVQAKGSDIPRWVRSVREEETESGDDPAACDEAGEEKLQALVDVAMACVSLTPENRPSMKDVLKMIRDVRAEAHFSPNSGDHAPGKWSGAVQSLPKEAHLSI